MKKYQFSIFELFNLDKMNKSQKWLAFRFSFVICAILLIGKSWYVIPFIIWLLVLIPKVKNELGSVLDED